MVTSTPNSCRPAAHAVVSAEAVNAVCRTPLRVLTGDRHCTSQRQCRFDEQVKPLVHLFTDRADLATGLVTRLKGMMKLHLLQRIELGGESAWYCTPLN